MRPSVWFIVPAHGRLELTAICLRQLRHTCDHLGEVGIDATAVVIASDGNGETALELGFGLIRRNNKYLSRKYNDGFQLALDPECNPRPADYAIPCGSDDWVHWSLVAGNLPTDGSIVGFQTMSFVREDGQELTDRFLNYPGGCGIRIYPRQTIAALGYRPADEDRPRGCDTSILWNLRHYENLQGQQLKIIHHQPDPRLIVDWKSDGANLNPYTALRRWRHTMLGDPFEVLAGLYPDAALGEMAAHYQRVSTKVQA